MSFDDLIVMTLTVIFWAIYIIAVGILVGLIMYLIFCAVLFLF